MANWISRFLGETQVRLLQLLRRSNQTITGLAEKLGVTDNAVRTHIAALDRHGLVEQVGLRREERGKPARVYAITREGEEVFPKAYATVLAGLVEEISRAEGRDRAVELLRGVGERVAAGVPHGKDQKARVQAAAQALRSLGGEVEVERTDRGWRLQGHGCPLSAVTTGHPEVCAVARALVEEMTGEKVTEACDRTERPRCAFLVQLA
jgi:predicted ArsR family transcriptional regulator